MAYQSQYANQATGSGLFVAEEEIRDRTFAEARHYGLLAGVRYGEPFVQKEVGLVDDLTLRAGAVDLSRAFLCAAMIPVHNNSLSQSKTL